MGVSNLRLVRTRGKNRALIAVAHSLLVTVYSFTPGLASPIETLAWITLTASTKNRLERSLVKRLEKLGHRVILEPRSPAA